MKIEQTECSETLAYKIQTPENYPEESIRHSRFLFLIKYYWNDQIKKDEKRKARNIYRRADKYKALIGSNRERKRERDRERGREREVFHLTTLSFIMILYITSELRG
jgi:hypothetical protein